MDKQPSCSTCDFMRRYGAQTMRCLWDPPTPFLVGMMPPRIEGMMPAPIVSGMNAEVSIDGFCRHHPDLRMEGEVRQSPGYPPPPQPDPVELRSAGGLIIPAEATRQ